MLQEKLRVCQKVSVTFTGSIRHMLAPFDAYLIVTIVT